MRVTRRTFLRSSAALGLAACRRPREAGAPLAPGELAVLAAVAERLVPSDEDPGAREANAAGYLARAVLRRDARRFVGSARAAIARLDGAARRGGARGFCGAGAAAQDALIAAECATPRGRAFVGDLLALTFEGVAADPCYGGNHGGAGWKLAGFAPPPPHAHACR